MDAVLNYVGDHRAIMPITTSSTTLNLTFLHIRREEHILTTTWLEAMQEQAWEEYYDQQNAILNKILEDEYHHEEMRQLGRSIMMEQSDSD